MGKGATDRGGRTDVRQRRALQKLGLDPFGTLGMEAGDGVVLDPELGTISIGLATNPGLTFLSGDLTVAVGNGLELTATGVEVDLATNPGLEFESGDIRVRIKAAGGITRDSDGLSQTQVADSGIYTPTITDGANVTSTTAYEALWTRQGNLVTVFTRVDVNPTGTGTDAIINISLPVALTANFGGFAEAFGSMSYHTTPNDGVSGVVFSESGAATVRAVFRPTNSANKGMQVAFRYNIDQS